ncbi:MAG: hypothetical protein KGJ62_01435 [Armatimonadetes bacterium]|nr:hypothetical protein [Armatimonadota bacterium]MDE2205832.1 hypothetical protein [Armatimonadota bacterium]
MQTGEAVADMPQQQCALPAHIGQRHAAAMAGIGAAALRAPGAIVHGGCSHQISQMLSCSGASESAARRRRRYLPPAEPARQPEVLNIARPGANAYRALLRQSVHWAIGPNMPFESGWRNAAERHAHACIPSKLYPLRGRSVTALRG